MNGVEKPSQDNRVASGEKSPARRQPHRANEDDFTRLRDDLRRKRHERPLNKLEKNQVFDDSNGKETLAELFDGLSNSIVNQFVLGAGREEGFANSSPCPIMLTAPLFI